MPSVLVRPDRAPMQFTEQFEVAVVGAGHAGCEAAVAAARMGLKTALFTLNIDLIAQMSCNPAIGGIAKGHLVREVDALGGIMGEVTDAVGIQFRLLNTSRGPAVWSPRAQCDKQAYRLKMRDVLESQPNLKIKQAEVAELIVEDRSDREYRAHRRFVACQKAHWASSFATAGPWARKPCHHHRDLSEWAHSLRRTTVSRGSFRRTECRAAWRGA